MKDCEQSHILSPNEEAELFQSRFAEQREDIEMRLAASSSVPIEGLREHFQSLNSSLQSLQKLYSSSSPYLRIYYRKIYQDALHFIQTKIQEEETRLMPRKKFVFKGNRAKNKPNSTAHENGSAKEPKKDSKVLDLVDGVNTCVFQDREDAVIAVPSHTVNGKAVLLSRLRNCTVQMMGAPSTVHIADVKGCSINCGPVATSVFVESAHSCQFQLACQQLRVHETTETDFYIHVTSKAIIEECRNVRFGTYGFSYPSIDEDYLVAGLNREVNNWRDVDDFNWLVAGQPSPNWSLIPNSPAHNS